MHPLVSARNYSTRVERYFPKETSDFFFPFFPPKKQEKRQGHTRSDRSELVEWNFQNDWERHFENKGMLRRNNEYIEFTSKPDESTGHDFHNSNGEGMGHVGWIQISSDLFAKRYRAVESSVNDVGWYVAYILLRLLIASVRFK